MKFWKVAGASVMAFGLVLGMATPALAAPHEGQQLQTQASLSVVHGEVISIDESGGFFVIQTADEEITVAVDGDTQYFAMPVLGKALCFANHIRGQVRLGMGLGIQQQTQAQAKSSEVSVPSLMARFRNENFVSARSQVCLNAGNAGEMPETIGEEAVFTDITVGSLVSVWTEESAEGDLVATRVFIIDPVSGDCPFGECPFAECPAGECDMENCPAIFGDCPVSECPGQGFPGQGCPKMNQGS